ncbi:MAG TPA: alginate lyase family protein [Vicinamibacterales bacterium]|nr:alginate lyase family protein [Vicinamibacterales bacterium]
MRDVAGPAPRKVFCIYERQYASRDIADAVVAGRFDLQGTALDLGTEPDWIGAALPADKEWRLEWAKFYYGLDLATAAEQTGDPAYVAAWQRLIRSWVAQVAIDHDPSDVVGRRIQNWIYAWSRFAACTDLEEMSPGFTAEITRSLGDQIAHLERHLTRERNHRTLELYALLVAALALPDLDPRGMRRELALAQLHRNLLDDILPDGVQRERSTHYHHVVLRSFLGARENLRRFGLAVPAGFDDRLERAVEFALHCHRPDGTIPALSDSDRGSYLDLLALAADLLARPDFLYAATRGAAGSPPPVRQASFPVGGYYVQRSGWGEGARRFGDEHYLMFDCGPLGDGGHGHYDALSVEIAACGAPLVVDPGRYTYCDDAPHWRRWFKGTAAHNTVTVDGLDQTPYRRGKPKGPVARARLVDRLTRPGFDLLWGEVVSPAYDAVHRRRVLFIGDEYWLIEDRLDGSSPHRYDLRFHLPPDPDRTLTLCADGAVSMARSANVVLAVSGSASAAIEPGWVSDRYGIKEQAPVLSFVQHAAGPAVFVTLVAPASIVRDALPQFSVRVETAVVHVDVIVVAGTRGARDHVAWSVDGDERSFDSDLQSRPAIAAWTRSGPGEGRRQSVALTRSDRLTFPAHEPGREMVEVER